MLALAQGLSPFLLFFISHIALLQAIAIASTLRPTSPLPPLPLYFLARLKDRIGRHKTTPIFMFGSVLCRFCAFFSISISS